jgi:hypothetical protein
MSDMRGHAIDNEDVVMVPAWPRQPRQLIVRGKTTGHGRPGGILGGKRQWR